MSKNYLGNNNNVVSSGYLATQLKNLVTRLRTVFADKTLEHTHANKTTILDKLDTDVNGDLTFDGVTVNGTSSTYDAHMKDTTIHINSTERSDIFTHLTNSTVHVTSAEKTAWNNKYDLPTGGIPLTDLDANVNTIINNKIDESKLIEVATGMITPDLINQAKISHLNLQDIGTKSHNEIEQMISNHISNTTIHNSKTLNAITIQNVDFLSGTFTNCNYNTTYNQVELDIVKASTPTDPAEYTTNVAVYESKIWDSSVVDCPWVSYSWLGDYNNDYTNIKAYVRYGSTSAYNSATWSNWVEVPYTKEIPFMGQYIQTKIEFSTADKNKNIILKNIIMYYGVDLGSELVDARPSLNGTQNANLKQRLDAMETDIQNNTNDIGKKVDNTTIANSTTLGLVQPEDLQTTDVTYTMDVKVDSNGKLWADADAQFKIDTIQTDNAITHSTDGYYVKDLSKDVTQNATDIADLQKKAVIGQELDHAFLQLTASYTPVKGAYVPFKIKEGNMTQNADNSINLKGGSTYQIDINISYQNVANKNQANITFSLMDITNNIRISAMNPLYNNVQYELADNMSCQYTPALNCSLALVAESVVTPDIISHAYSHFTIHEVGRQIIVDPSSPTSDTQDSPIGSVITYMGTTAPAHYLMCDGSVYNITDYQLLADFINDNYGSYNFFGGDGVTTFAVPDLRGEFLRGAGTNSHPNQGNGANVGIHQDGTEHLQMYASTNALIYGYNIGQCKNYDYLLPPPSVTSGTRQYNSASTQSNNNYNSFFTSRPTNTSVNYCIKYEVTSYMQCYYGGFNKTVLFDGVANSVGTTYTLADDIANYDLLVIGTGGAVSGYNNDSITISTDYLLKVLRVLVASYQGGVYYDYSFTNTDFTTVGSSSTTGNINCIHHIVGIKGTT